MGILNLGCNTYSFPLLNSGRLVSSNYVAENALNMYAITFHLPFSHTHFTQKKTERLAVYTNVNFPTRLFPDPSPVHPSFLKLRITPPHLYCQSQGHRPDGSPTVSQETDLYSTKFYTSGILRHFGANPQHSTVTNGQTLEPAGGR